MTRADRWAERVAQNPDASMAELGAQAAEEDNGRKEVMVATLIHTTGGQTFPTESSRAAVLASITDANHTGYVEVGFKGNRTTILANQIVAVREATHAA